MQTGFKERFLCFCFDYIWAWWNGVSYDKNKVTNSIAEAFQEVSFGRLNVYENDLRSFSNNLSVLKDKFQHDRHFNSRLLEELISRLRDHILLTYVDRFPPILFSEIFPWV